METIMRETICLQCGDRGFTNAFIYCIKCLDVAVHRYCLDVIPKTFDEFVHWVCDDCETEAQNQSAVRENDAILSKRTDLTVSKNIEGFPGRKNDTVVSEEEKAEEHVYRDSLEEEKAEDNLVQNDKLSNNTPKKNKKNRKNKKNKKRSIVVSTMEKDQHQLGNKSCKISYEEQVKVEIVKCARLADDSTLPKKVEENMGSRHTNQKCISKKPFDSDSKPGTVEHPIISCNGSFRSSKRKITVKLSEAVLQEQMHRNGSAQPLKETEGQLENQCDEKSIEGRNVGPSNGNTEIRKSENRGERTSLPRQVISFKDSQQDLVLSSAVPVVLPIWRGSFNIWNKKHDLLNGLVAHLSSKACQKVYDAASHFQPILHLEMLPKSDVWPKSFQTSEPSGDNIALYFFPSMISERVFDHLVEDMMHKELALKVVLQNAELLIFTSTELPLLYWRFQSNYYLWGVFRGKQSPSSHFHSYTEDLGDIPTTHTDLPNGSGLSESKIPLTMKRCGAQSLISPLSNSASYGSGGF